MLIALYKLLNDPTTIETAGRHRARQAFLSMNDRLLADAGISREKLNQGVKAWPWTVEAPISSHALTSGDVSGNAATASRSTVEQNASCQESMRRAA